VTRVAGRCGRPRPPRFTAEIIDAVERAKAPAVPQASDMKSIGQLLLIWSPATSGIGAPVGHALLPPTPAIELHQTLHAPTLL
jgi:hypothetical protein